MPLQMSMWTANDGRSTALINFTYALGPSGRLQGHISIEKLVERGLISSMILRQFSTVASKNSFDKLLGCAPYQTFGLYEPAMSTQQRAPTASAKARRSTT